ncbi:MAG: chloride channel protein [Verrucomicrobiaceae bacterium]
MSLRSRSRTLADRLRARLDVGQRFMVFCVVCGLLCGLVAVAFHFAIHGLFDQVWRLAERMNPGGFVAVMLLAPTLGGLAVGLGVKYLSPNSAGSGIPQTKAAYFNNGGKISARDGFWRFVLGTLYVGLGNSLGREGPTVHVSAAIGSRIGRWGFRDRQRQQALVPVGVAGGVAAAFNAPIAAIMFVFEELMDGFSMKALGGIAVAVVIAAATSRMILGENPIVNTHLSPDYHTSLWMLVALPLGLVAGLFGTAFTASIVGLRGWVREREAVPVWIRPAAGGLAMGCLGLAGWYFTGLLGEASHDVFSVGYDSLELAFEAKLAIGILAVLFVLKGLAVVVNYATGGSGGLFSPTLFLGGMIGGMMGFGMAALNGAVPIPGYPGDQEVIGGCVLLGMGALFGAVIRNPLTSLIMIFEMTGNYSLILPIMGGNLLAWGIATRLQRTPIYDALLMQDGISLKRMPSYRGGQDYAQLPIAAIMTHDVETIPLEANVSQTRTELRRRNLQKHSYPVVAEDGGLCGLVTRGELQVSTPETKIAEIVDEQVLMTFTPDVSIRDAANRLIENDYQQAPVVSAVDPRRLVGVITLNDITRQQNAAEV